jgi:1,4-alpha-glucan branching enzyme
MDDRENAVFAFLRKGEAQHKPVLVIANMTPRVQEGYTLGCPVEGDWKLLLSTDDDTYGGSGVGLGDLRARPEVSHGLPASLTLTLPPLATVFLTPEG